MRPRVSPFVLVALAAFGFVACGGEEPPPVAPAAPSAVTPAPSAVASAAPSASEAPATPAQAPEPTPEEKKKAEAAKKLQEDRAKWEEDNKAELARWTPELHAAAKALADKTYPSGHAALVAAIAGKQRKPGDAARDKYRHPLETLEFFGFKPTMTVLEISPGEGWFTEILAPALAAKGKLLATSNDPNGPADDRSAFNGQGFRAFLDKAPELFGKVQTVVVDDKAPSLPADGTIDLVLLMREAHGMVNSGTLDAWLDAIHGALKNGGVLGVEEHRAAPGADPMQSAKKGYLPEKWLVEQVESKGFTLAGKSEVNANAKDTKDYPEGVWSLPPSFRQGDVDHDKYAAIGESDRMTLKFVKAAEKHPGAAPTSAKK
jgi:predicted methyltransferase